MAIEPMNNMPVLLGVTVWQGQTVSTDPLLTERANASSTFMFAMVSSFDDRRRIAVDYGVAKRLYHQSDTGRSPAILLFCIRHFGPKKTNWIVAFDDISRTR
ncbi:MAG: hypothetical protein ACTSWI_03425 [Alphaproteobacteria bacterium]